MSRSLVTGVGLRVKFIYRKTFAALLICMFSRYLHFDFSGIKIALTKKGMKRKALALGILVFLSSSAQIVAQSKYLVLENGLKVFLLEKHTSPLLNISLAINLGTKDESDETSGLGHLLEHSILFRNQVNEQMEASASQELRRHGAYFNGHTGQDLIVFEISLPSSEVDFALANQKDILTGSRFSQKGLEEEKEVILKEISQIEDDPLRLATSLLYQNLFKNHPYGRPVYGSRESIKSITPEQMDSYYRKYFVPPNCALAAVGDFAIAELEDKIRGVFGGLKNEPFYSPVFSKVPLLTKRAEISRELDIKQAYLVIGVVGPDYNDPDQFGVDVMTEILGRGVNPLLNTALRSSLEFGQTVSMSYVANEYGGGIWATFTLEPKNVNRTKNEAIDFLRKTRDLNFSKNDYLGEERFYAYDFLGSAKNQIKFNAYQAQERGLDIAVAMAKHMLLGKETADSGFLNIIDKISSSDLRQIAGKYWSKGEYVVVTILPEKKD